MPKVSLTESLRREYQTLFDTCQVKPAKVQEVEALTGSLIAHQARYLAVGTPLGIPWYVIAVIHNMECGQRFDQHLHNGDPLTARTTHVPAGRPKAGQPPFTWEQSAADALIQHGLDQWQDWSLPGVLYALEGYNGWGYRLYHPAVKSPYLWSGSSHYTSGKYVSDGTWSDTAVSAQCGAATLLRRLAEKGELAAAPSSPALAAPLFAYTPDAITPNGAAFQHYLNSLPGIFLKEDGKLGEKTSNACKAALGFYLQGDPRR